MFDKKIERRGTSCLKWDWDKRLTGRERLLPFWIADMDFKAPPPVLEALQNRLDHGIFGYSSCPESLIDSMASWFERRQGWKINKDCLLEVPGTVPFIHIYIQHFTEQGESIIIQEPVYYPFRQSIERNDRQVISNDLRVDSSGRWVMDLGNLEEIIQKSGARTLILCSPHNPVSRVWSRQELTNLANICRKGGVTVLSDEIHSDLVQPGYRHIPWLSLEETQLPKSLIILSATKAFNLPGLSTAWVLVYDEIFRREIAGSLETLGLRDGCSSPLSYTAAEAAWTKGDEWLDALINYIGKNYELMRDFLTDKIPELEIAVLEGTYLAWINTNLLNISEEDVSKRLLDRGVWLSRGSQFGSRGKGYIRMNLACPQNQLEMGLEKIVKALKQS